MSFISSVLGSAGVNQANIMNPVTQGQVNQSYTNTQTGLQQQQALLQALQSQNGVQNQSDVYNQLQGVANGTGPNPAQTMLNQATGQNVAQQAALGAGQRGVSSNVGLLERQNAQQGAGIQQQAAGQGASLQAQQSLNAIGQAGGIAGQQVGQQQNAVQGYQTGALNQQSNLLGGVANYNQQLTANQNGQNARNTSALGGLLGAAGTIAGGYFGGPAGAAAGGALGGQLGSQWGSSGTGVTDSGFTMPSMGSSAVNKAHGGEIDEPKSLIGRHLKMCSGGMAYKQGGQVSGGQAPVAGDSLKNDTVDAKLSPHEIVIPRSITMGENAPEKAKQFVAAILAKKSMGKK